MRKWNFITVVFIFIISSTLGFGQEGYSIDLQVKNAKSDTLYLAYFYGDANYISDTAYRDERGHFLFTGAEPLPEGVYMFVMPPENTFFQILIDDQQHFNLTTDAENITRSTRIEGNEDNALFYDYLGFIDQARNEKTKLQESMESISEPAAREEVEKQIIDLDRKVLKKQDDILENYPNSLSAMVIGASREPHIPDFPDTSEEERRKKALKYYQEHYFDLIDLNRPAILRTPFIHEKVMSYFDKYISQDPDSLIRAVDGFFGRLDEESTMYRYFLVKLLNKYANPSIVGHDAVYVHLANEYYGKGKAPWVDEETLTKILDNAERFNFTLIGNPAPALQLYDFYAEKEVQLLDIEAEYKVLIFWSSSCNHCEKVMPTIPDIKNEIDDSSVVFVSVCTRSDDSCKKFTDENEIGSAGIHTLPVSPYGRQYDVRSTPKVFIIDRDNKIASKGIGFSQISEVIDLLKKNKDFPASGTSLN